MKMYWNFVKSESYRALRMKSVYILPIILLVLVLINGVMVLKVDLFATLGLDREQYDMIAAEGAGAQGIQDSFSLGFNAGIDASATIIEGSDEEGDIEDLAIEPVELFGEGVLYREDVPVLFNNLIMGLDTLLFIAIFTGLFIGDTYSTGFGKNLVIGNRKRTVLLSARLTVVALYTFIIHILSWVFTIITAALMAESVKLNIDASFIKYFIFSWLMSFSFALLVTVITILTKSKAAGIAIGVILSAGMFTLVISLATIIVREIWTVPDDFDIAKFTLTQNLGTLTLDSAGSDVIRGLLCAVIYGAIFIVTGIIINKKRDIN